MVAAETGVRSSASRRIDPVLRRLHADVVVDAVCQFTQKFGATVPLPLSEISMLLVTSRWVRPNCDGFDAVHVEADLRLVHHLVHVHVGCAGDARDPRGELLGDL